MATKNLSEIIKNFVDILPEKQKDIIEKRYGLSGDKPLTLEAIGRQKGLTRERIRQIETAALLKLKQNLDELDDLLEKIKYQLEIIGGIRREKKLLEEAPVSLIAKPDELWRNEKIKSQWQSCVNFLLDLSPDFSYFFEKPNIYSNWYLREEVLKKVFNIYKFVEKELHLVKRPLLLDEYQLLLRKTMKEFKINNENILISYLDISKKFAFNPFGEFGLTDWEFIKPKNIRTKAFLILQKTNKPLYYQEIARAINEVNFDNKITSINSLHNELIKDRSFVLVGRGVYALKEWGYQPGTIKDLLVSILRQKPMHFRDILNEVGKQRIVKDMTVLINLQDKKLFRKLPDKRYSLIRSGKR